MLVGGLLLPAASYGWNGNLTLLHEWYRTVTDTTGPNLFGHREHLVRLHVGEVDRARPHWPRASRWPRRSSLSRRGLPSCGGGDTWLSPTILKAAYFFVLIPLLSPQGWDYVLLIALPAYMCLVDRWRDLSPNWRAVALTGFFLTSFTIFDLLRRPLYIHLMELAAVSCWRRADCRLPHSLAVAGDRVSAGVSPETHVSDMTARLRPFALLALIVLAVVVYNTRVRHEMIDFITWRQAAVRALDAEPLYRPEDGHYQFKYFPMFAVMMAPFGVVDQDTGKMLWFAIEVGLLAALLRWSIAALPERRLSQGTLLVFAIVLMAKFYAHELLLGQTNLLLGALLAGGAARRPDRSADHCRWARGLGRLRQTVRADSGSLAARHSGLAQPPPWPPASW